MSTQAVSYENFLTRKLGWKSWFFTRDHKRIALMFLITITAIFFRRRNVCDDDSAGVDDSARRPFYFRDVQQTVFDARDRHGVVFSHPVHTDRVRQFPGSNDDRSPRPGISPAESLELVSARHREAFSSSTPFLTGGVDTGWTFYTPYSSQFANTHVVAALAGIFISGFSSILTGLNFIVTIHKLRAPGMTWRRLPLFVWSTYATAVILVLATPVLAITLDAGRNRAADRSRHLRSGARRGSAAVPASLLVLFTPSRVHHDPARYGGHQRTGHDARASGESSDTNLWRGPVSPSQYWDFWCGDITCLLRASRHTRNMIFSILSFAVSDSFRD